jgi:hypothetical protein
MEMQLPENTLPMMTGDGPFGGIEMGGMFTTVKVRKGLARNDYADPGWYRQPAGTVAYEWSGDAAAIHAASPATSSAAGAQPSRPSPSSQPPLDIRRGGAHRH